MGNVSRASVEGGGWDVFFLTFLKLFRRERGRMSFWAEGMGGGGKGRRREE